MKNQKNKRAAGGLFFLMMVPIILGGCGKLTEGLNSAVNYLQELTLLAKKMESLPIVGRKDNTQVGVETGINSANVSTGNTFIKWNFKVVTPEKYSSQDGWSIRRSWEIYSGIETNDASRYLNESGQVISKETYDELKHTYESVSEVHYSPSKFHPDGEEGIFYGKETNQLEKVGTADRQVQIIEGNIKITNYKTGSDIVNFTKFKSILRGVLLTVNGELAIDNFIADFKVETSRSVSGGPSKREAVVYLKDRTKRIGKINFTDTGFEIIEEK